MRTLTSVAVVGALVAWSAAATAAGDSAQTSSSVLSDIVNLLARQGRISPASASLLGQRIARGEAPSLSADPLVSGSYCLTTAMKQAVQWIGSQGVSVQADAPAGNHLVSTKYPITVNYDTEETLAKTALALAEDAWKAQVEEGKFPAPWTVTDTGTVSQGMVIDIADLGQNYAGMAEPVADVPSTPICDCASHILINSMLTSAQLTEVIAHEFNHTVQDSSDCTESFSAHESFAVATSSLQLPASQYLTKAFLPAFQANPEYPVDYMSMAGTSTYHFGAALFPIFLAEKYGNGQISFLGQLWTAFEQHGTSSISSMVATCSNPNKPNWFDGVDAVLKQQGTSFDEAFDEFSVWRSITGSYDDGAHFKNGGKYQAVAIAATHSLDALPIQGNLELQEYGSRHIELTPDSFSGGLKLSVAGDPAVGWGGALLAWKGDGPVQVEKLAFSAESGSVSVASIQGITRLVLVVTQKNFAGHDPDAPVYDAIRSFSYSVEELSLPDAGPGPGPEPDAGVTPPGATPKPGGEDSAGCGCRTSSGTPLGLAPLALLAAALGALRRRRPAR